MYGKTNEDHGPALVQALEAGLLGSVAGCGARGPEGMQEDGYLPWPWSFLYLRLSSVDRAAVMLFLSLFLVFK